MNEKISNKKNLSFFPKRDIQKPNSHVAANSPRGQNVRGWHFILNAELYILQNARYRETEINFCLFDYYLIVQTTREEGKSIKFLIFLYCFDFSTDPNQ